jgi:hypothetical protein
MTERGMLTASIVMRSACAGNMPIVETAMAHLAGTSRARARDVLCGGGAGFTSLYRNSGLPSTCIGLISAAGAIEGELRDMKITLKAENFGRRLIEQIMTGDGAMSQTERAKYLDLIARYSGERVRMMAERLRQGLLAAA